MNKPLKQQADEVMQILMELPMVKGCTLYGSLISDKADEMSDIDIQVDVSGYDNGKFMLELTDLLRGKLPICYSDYAPSMIPDKYIVSLAVDEENPFRIVDICCCARPHCTTVTRQQVAEKNGRHTHLLKLWTANLKHYARGKDCCGDIMRMAQKIGAANLDQESERTILAEVLNWLEENAESEVRGLVGSCRKVFERLA